MPTEPRATRLERPRGRKPRLAGLAEVDVAGPRAVEIHPARVGVRRAAYAEGEVRIPAQRRAVAVHQVHFGARALVILRKVHDQLPHRLPVEGDGVVGKRLVAVHAGPDGVPVQREDLRVENAERRGGDTARPIGRSHRGGIIAAGDEGADRVEDRAVVLDVHRTAVEPALGAVASRHTQRLHRDGRRDQAGREGHRGAAERLAVVVPGQDLVGVGERADDRGLVAAGLAHRRDREGARGPPRDRGEGTALVLEIERAPAAAFLVQPGERQRQAVLKQHAVGVELEPVAPPGADAVPHRRRVAVRLRDLRGLVQQTAGRADAEEDAVRAARVLETADAVGIRRRDAREVVHPEARDQPAALDAGRQRVAADDAVLLRAGALRVGVHLAVHRVLHQFAKVGDREIVEELRREDRDRARGVAQAGVQAAAGERVLRRVADVAARVHRERAELDHGVLPFLRRRRGGKSVQRQQEDNGQDGRTTENGR